MTMTDSNYRSDEKCTAAGCDGVPFFGESASRGYCDSCHVARCEAWAACDKLDALFDAGDEDAYYELRDEVLDRSDRSAAFAEVARDAGYPVQVPVRL